MIPGLDIYYGAQLFWYLACLLTSVQGMLNESMSNWRQARSTLKADIKGHLAVKDLLNPAQDVENPFVDITFNFWTYKILEVSDVEQSITTISLLHLQWRDQDLAWNASQYQGIQTISLKHDEVWRPVLLTMNAADDVSLLLPDNLPIIRLTNDGVFNFFVPIFLKTSCIFDLTFFPFDKQRCSILVVTFFDDCESRISSASLLNLTDPFTLGGEWTIVDRSLSKENYSTDAFDQPMVRIDLLLKRSISYYILSFMAPMLLTSMMSSLVFLIPPAAGEKVSFLVSIYVSNSVFLSFMVSSMPRSLTELPRIALFILVVMIECFFALLATLFVIQRYHQELKELHVKDLDEHMPEHDVRPAGNQDKSCTSDELLSDSLFCEFDDDAKEMCVDVRKRSTIGEVRRNKVVPDNTAAQPGSGHQDIRRRGRRIKAKEWDLIFFMLYHLTSLPIYLGLVLIK